MKKLIVLLLVLAQTIAVAQRKTRADRYFEKGDYINAAINYEKELARYDHTKRITQNIADSYYNTYEFRKARYYLKKLFQGRFKDEDKTYDNEYNFKMYQVLSAMGYHVNAVDYLAKYKEGLGEKLDKKETIETIEEFKLKTSDYNINRSRFNTTSSDFGAVVQGDSLYFVSDRTENLFKSNYGWTHRPYLDIYRASIKDGKVNPLTIEPLPKEINSKLHEGNFCFANNGNVIYVSRSNITKSKKIFDKKKTNNVQLFKAERVNGKWTSLKKLPFCEDGYSYEHPNLSPDGKTLYFSSNREGGYGSFDIYSVEVEGNHEGYGAIKNLGATINTPNREQFPFISKEGNLFFASNGHLGLGMLDNFVSELKDGKFTKPINLGAPINSKYDDFNIVYTNDTDGYFATNRKGLVDNIYEFSQTGEIFEREYINIFEVRDAETNEYISNAKVVLLDKKGNQIYHNTLSDKASFTMNLLPSEYKFSAEADSTYFKNSKMIKTIEKQQQKHVILLSKKPEPKPEPVVVAPPIVEKDDRRTRPVSVIDPIKKDKTETKPDTTQEETTTPKPVVTEPTPTPVTPTKPVVVAEVKPKKKRIPPATNEKEKRRNALLLDTEGPEVFLDDNNDLYFKLPPIYFEFDKWTITEESKKVLDDFAKKLERYPRVYIKISSHTDNIGTAGYNQILSERRAEATRNYLALEAYINARRMQFEGFGESQPLIDCGLNCTDEERQLNRRSEFKIIQY